MFFFYWIKYEYNSSRMYLWKFASLRHSWCPSISFKRRGGSQPGVIRSISTIYHRKQGKQIGPKTSPAHVPSTNIGSSLVAVMLVMHLCVLAFRSKSVHKRFNNVSFISTLVWETQILYHFLTAEMILLIALFSLLFLPKCSYFIIEKNPPHFFLYRHVATFSPGIITSYVK